VPLPLLAGDFAFFAGDFAIAYDSLASAVASAGEGLRRWASPITVEIAEGDDAVSLAAPHWRRIEAEGGAATPFQRLAVAEIAAAVHRHRGETPRVVVVRDQDRPLVVFPTVTAAFAGRRVIRFLGDPLIQYGDILAAPEAEQRHIEAAWSAVADPRVASAVLLRKVRADARVAPVLARHARTVAETSAPFVDLRQPQPQNARNAKELRRFWRRLSEQGAVRFELLRGEAAQPALRQALSFKRAWLAARGLESSVIGNPDWEELLATLTNSHRGAGLLSAARLSVADGPAAIEIGIIHGHRWCSFLGAINPAFAKAGPGHVQMAETIEHCRANGFAIYDLMAPADLYKQRLATDAVVVRDHAAALGVGGRLAVLAAHSAPHIKAFINRLPLPLRRITRHSLGRFFFRPR
jgi:CelD/BcsL family acetyltransferase involved in cellulose biosynthesis